MKNLLTTILSLAIIIFVGLGCSYLESTQRSVQDTTTNSNSAANVARDTLGLKKSGITECDLLVDVLADKRKQNANQEQSWTDKAAEEAVKQLVYDQLSKNDTNRTPQEKEDLAKKCKLALDYVR
jgi:hypothetical protein